MKRSTQPAPDLTFGRQMLELRTTIGLTQAALSDLLGVSRHAIGAWETGQTYPKPDRLRRFIELASRQQAFAAGREADEIRALWRACRRSGLLDEQWLAQLLGQQATPIVSASPEQTGGAGPTIERSASGGPQLDWDDALDVSIFYGRTAEQALLASWIGAHRCRVVSVLGLGGIGKSALTITVMREVASQFDVVVWRSVRDMPSCETLLESCLHVLMPWAPVDHTLGFEQRLQLWMEQLRQRRVLLVLDNIELLLGEGARAGRFRAGFEPYARLLQSTAETAHQSCVLLTSREQLADLAALEGGRAPVRAMRLGGLDPQAAVQLLLDKDLPTTPAEQERLIGQYSGNPLALKIVAQTIVDLFGGDIGLFFTQGEVIIGGVRELLREHFDRLSALEQQLIVWLAIMREPLGWQELLELLHLPPASGSVLEALSGLSRRSLVERGQRPGSFTLQSVVLEYATARLIEETSHELAQGRFAQLTWHGLVQAQAKDYIRTAQERLLLQPVLAQLQLRYHARAELEAHLSALLDQLRPTEQRAQGYGPANVIALLRQLRGDLRGLDLSRLCLRGLFLQGVAMQDTNLAHALLHNSVLTEAFDEILAVAISPDGAYWAAVSRSGEIRIWDHEGRTLRYLWQTYADVIWQHIAFSPDGRTLVSISSSGAAKEWELASGRLLWSRWLARGVTWLAFSPDGHMLAYGERAGVIHVLDRQYGTLLEELRIASAVSCLAWSPNGQLLVSTDRVGTMQFWQLQPGQPTRCVQTLAAHSDWIPTIAFSPDGTWLASCSYDGTLKLWDVASGTCLQTFAEHTGRVLRVAWSPDGRTIATGGSDYTIRLWDGVARAALAVLHDHTSVITSLAFAPQGRTLLSGSSDGTVRVWDVESRQCKYVIRGHVDSIIDIDWSPEGAQLVSCGADRLVAVWNIASGTVLHLLAGHNWTIQSVAWHPGGQVLVSSGHDNRIRLWDVATGALRHELRDPDGSDTVFQRAAWSPDGRQLACGSYGRGVQVWDMHTFERRWIGQGKAPLIRDVIWRPDGALVAGSGDDGAIYVWYADDGTLARRLVGHTGLVTKLAWSDDGRWLASGAGTETSGELFVWDAETGALLHSLAPHPGIVSAVAWGPGGEHVISGSSDGMVRWWDVERGRCVQLREGHNGTVRQLRCSADGSRLASCGTDGQIVIWDAARAEPVHSLRRDRPYERMVIDGVTGITEAQRASLVLLGAAER